MNERLQQSRQPTGTNVSRLVCNVSCSGIKGGSLIDFMNPSAAGNRRNLTKRHEIE